MCTRRIVETRDSFGMLVKHQEIAFCTKIWRRFLMFQR